AGAAAKLAGWAPHRPADLGLGVPRLGGRSALRWAQCHLQGYQQPGRRLGAGQRCVLCGVHMALREVDPPAPGERGGALDLPAAGAGLVLLLPLLLRGGRQPSERHAHSVSLPCRQLGAALGPGRGDHRLLPLGGGQGAAGGGRHGGRSDLCLRACLGRHLRIRLARR
ncbi:unnamed protein product, partial [Effrenium voratum]